MSTTKSGASPGRLTPLQWLIIVIAAIGFAFDSYELLMLPLIVQAGAHRAARRCRPTARSINDWAGIIFYVPAVAGGIFGLLGGYLTDVFGRRRGARVEHPALRASRRLPAGFSTSVEWLLFWRCCTFVGVCVEFVAAVAWLSELFPNPKQREAIVGYTQSVGSIGGIMATAGYYLAVTYGQLLPEVRGGHEAWRYTLMSGIIPAIPLIVIRPFLPESPIWHQKKQAGTLKRPSFGELFPPRVPHDDHRHDGDDGGGVRRGIRRHPADAAHRARSSGSARRCRARGGTDRQRRAVVSGIRRPGGTDSDGLSRRAHRQPAQLLRLFQIPGLGHRSQSCSRSPARAVSRCCSGVFSSTASRRSASSVSGATTCRASSHVPARHRRELRRQHRRSHDRHVGGAADHAAGERDAGRDRTDAARVRGGARRHARLRPGSRRELLAAGTETRRTAGLTGVGLRAEG